MATGARSLRDLNNFGNVAAEDDAVLSYFLTTNAVSQIKSCERFLVLGRKGSGKTALVRHFAEGKDKDTTSKSINLRGYPWPVHEERIDSGASDIEAYVSSWRYLIAVELATLVMTRVGSDHTESSLALTTFLKENYGGVNPELGDVLRPQKLRLSKTSFEPQVMGNKLGGISFERNNARFGRELNALTDLIFEAVGNVAFSLGLPALILHFDELDQGLTTMDDSRKKMLVGLILAARAVRYDLRDFPIKISAVVYLRTDLWEELQFSDKNKITQTLALNLEWNSQSLKSLINERLQAKLGIGNSWDGVSSTALMRGSQTKWDHILARTFLRPRDVISFLNATLVAAKKRSAAPLLFENEDIVNAREPYSLYLKQELDDEIIPHWKQWDEALQACSAMSTITFDRDQFINEYNRLRTDSNSVKGDDALRLLYDFSVIGQQRRSGYGGSSWAFQYTSPEAGWDLSITSYKVHLGLKEFAKLREERLRED